MSSVHHTKEHYSSLSLFCSKVLGFSNKPEWRALEVFACSARGYVVEKPEVKRGGGIANIFAMLNSKFMSCL